MKVLFLDIDGVLNSTRSVLARAGIAHRSTQQQCAIRYLKGEFSIEDELPYGPSYTVDTIDAVAVGLVNRLLKKDADLNIVLSSTHRKHFQGSRFKDIEFGSAGHIEVLQEYMNALGLYGERLIGITESLGTRRGIEVRDWLDRHPEVTTHVAIDDGADFEPQDCNFIRIDPTEGLSSENYFDITKVLGIHESTIIF